MGMGAEVSGELVSGVSKANCERLYGECVDDGKPCEECDAFVTMWCGPG